ncbi:MAG: hypothetical protein K2W96_13835 [Gemmataceae bacterium]|nr:hypothetical protein [Gemmataceae bacterium]
MPHPFDATLKSLGKDHAADFVAMFDAPTTETVTPLNVDLSTVTTSADLVFGLGDPLKEVVHIDFQAGANRKKGRAVLVYNALLHENYEVPVHSVLVLLRPSADHSEVTGEVAYAARPGRSRMEFGYEIVRLWQVPAEEFLRGPLGTLPLAVLGGLPAGTDRQAGLTEVVRSVLERLAAEAPPGWLERLQVSMAELLALVVKRKEVRNIFGGAGVMLTPGTPVYEGLVDIGVERQTKLHILKLGKRKLGEADEAIRTKLEAIDDIERLERIFDRAADAPSWDDLLATP